jgi:hypothetical protein
MSTYRDLKICTGTINYVNVERPSATDPPDAAWRVSRPGAYGAVGDFRPGIDLMFAISFHPSDSGSSLRMSLELAALIRRRSALAEISPPGERPLDEGMLRLPPAGAGQGGGCTIGRHQLYCDQENRVLWLDEHRLVSLQAINVVLLREDDETLVVMGTDSIAEELGQRDVALRLDDAQGAHLGDFLRQIRQVAEMSPSVREFLSAR